jgi:hypothetical protein
LSDYNITTLFQCGNYLLAATGDSGVFRSTDMGASWEASNTGLPPDTGYFPEPYPGITSFVQSGSNLFCGSSFGHVFLSKDSGASWSFRGDIEPGAIAGITSLAMIGKELIASGGAIYRSSDSGRTWTQAAKGSPVESIQTLFVVGANIFAGTSNGIFLSSDIGASWSDVSEGLKDSNIQALAILGDTMFAAPVASGVWIRPLLQMMNNSAVTASTAPPTMEWNYPNPFTRQTTIPFSLNQTEHVEIKIFDVLGNEITSLADQDFDAGQHEVVWDAQGATPGIYFCRISTADGVQTQSLVLEEDGSR